MLRRFGGSACGAGIRVASAQADTGAGLSMKDLPESAGEIAQLIGHGAIRVGDDLTLSLQRVSRDNPGPNAISRLNPYAAAEVDHVRHRLEAGEVLPLVGVPVVIKDNLRGWRDDRHARRAAVCKFCGPSGSDGCRAIADSGGDQHWGRGDVRICLYGGEEHPVLWDDPQSG